MMMMMMLRCGGRCLVCRIATQFSPGKVVKLVIATWGQTDISITSSKVRTHPSTAHAHSPHQTRTSQQGGRHATICVGGSNPLARDQDRAQILVFMALTCVN
jgi:hypothetical protein